METPLNRIKSYLRCNVLRPVLRLLRRGVSPKKLAWSLAVSLLVGINPFLGMTTVVMLLVAAVFRLNHVATQIGIHLVTPLQWLLFVPFVRAGMLLFGSERMPLTSKEILHMSHRHPLRLVEILWQWEWHALVIWAVCAAALVPVIAVQIRKLLILAMRRHRDLLVGV